MVEKKSEYTKIENARARVLVIECVFNLKDADDVNIQNDILEHIQQWGTAGIREDFFVSETYEDASEICRKRCKI